MLFIGPFYPTPPPFPTFVAPENFDPNVCLVAPVPDEDVGDKKEPENPYQ